MKLSVLHFAQLTWKTPGRRFLSLRTCGCACETNWPLLPDGLISFISYQSARLVRCTAHPSISISLLEITIISVFWKRSEQSFPGQVTHCHHSTQMSAVTISYLQELAAWIKKTPNQPKSNKKVSFCQQSNILLISMTACCMKKKSKNFYKQTFLSRFSLVKLDC